MAMDNRLVVKLRDYHKQGCQQFTESPTARLDQWTSLFKKLEGDGKRFELSSHPEAPGPPLTSAHRSELHESLAYGVASR